MSASVATSTVGLLDRRCSPPSISPEPNAPAWPDVMEIDRPSDETIKQNGINDAIHGAHREATRRESQTKTNRHDTIGGLLAALTTITSNSSSLTRLHSVIRRSVTPPVDSPISPTSQTEDGERKEEGAPGTPNHTHLPPVDANNQDQNAPSTSFPDLPLDADADADADAATVPTHFSDDRIQSITQEDLPMPISPLDMSKINFPHMPTEAMPLPVRRQIDAYARLEFADGTFYLNTFQCELGRDQHAYRDALKREKEAQEIAKLEEVQAQSSSGKASQRPSQRSYVLRTAESQIQGSVVSEAGGFAGVDEKPVEAFADMHGARNGAHHSSQASESSIVRPSEVLHNPSLVLHDYNKDLVYQSAQLAAVPENDLVEDEQPAPVTEDHLPDPNSCPLIPIHPTFATDETEVQCLRNISRRHVRIFWSWDCEDFCMEVLGRNGAFLDRVHLPRGHVVRLYSGAQIQISAVEAYFRLPNRKQEQPDDESDSDAASEALESSPSGHSIPADDGKKVKLKLKLTTETSGLQSTGPSADLKRRGPGRPPKNGVMSQREMKEREKAEKDAKTRAANGIPSPPAMQRKPSRSQLPKPEPLAEPLKPEKRKYTKRKREDGEEEEVLPSIEAHDETPAAEPAPPPPPPPLTAKRARTKSYSPEYKLREECSVEDLARPPHNYAVLLYMVLSDTGEITLRQIYKQMQARWPYFKYMVDSDGWTSSVRHNLNQEVGKLFERGRKEGKGFTWLPKPNAMEEYQAQKNKRSNAPPVPKPRPTTQRTSFPANQGQQLTWQNNAPVAQRENFTHLHQGPWNGQQANGAKSEHSKPPISGPQGPNSSRQTPSQASGAQQTGTPDFVPPVDQLHFYFGKPAPRFLPVTFEGLAVIHRFEQSMFQNLKQDKETQDKWHEIFRSARRRALHGAEKSLLPGGETSEEATILKHITNFVTTYKNPAFEGFNVVSTLSPALGNAATAIGGPSPAVLGSKAPWPMLPAQSASTTATSTAQQQQSMETIPGQGAASPPSKEQTPMAISVAAVAPSAQSQNHTIRAATSPTQGMLADGTASSVPLPLGTTNAPAQKDSAADPQAQVPSTSMSTIKNEAYQAPVAAAASITMPTDNVNKVEIQSSASPLAISSGLVPKSVALASAHGSDTAFLTAPGDSTASVAELKDDDSTAVAKTATTGLPIEDIEAKPQLLGTALMAQPVQIQKDDEK